MTPHPTPCPACETPTEPHHITVLRTGTRQEYECVCRETWGVSFVGAQEDWESVEVVKKARMAYTRGADKAAPRGASTPPEGLTTCTTTPDEPRRNA